MNNSDSLGQFFTTNYKYILQNMYIPKNIKNIIEPFAGNGDLLKFIKNDKKYNIKCFDIDPKKDFIIKKDTLLNSPNYNNYFIITNPPYLARNKSINKQIFNKYKTNDLYKCFLNEIIINTPIGGIIILPLNFWCSIRKSDINLRKRFLNKFKIILINIFEEKVFDDTTYTICSFQFELKNNDTELLDLENNLNITIYPKNIKIKTKLNILNNYLIGGEIYNLKQNIKIKIERLTKKNNIEHNKQYITNILVKCIDDNKNKMINLSYINNDNDIYIDNTPNLTARTYATLIIKPKISKDKQKIIIKEFNKYLLNKRKNYNSLFLTNYRESKEISRKRISFTLVYQIINYLLNLLNQD